VMVTFGMSFLGNPTCTLHKFDSFLSSGVEQSFHSSQSGFNCFILLNKIPSLAFYFIVSTHGATGFSRVNG
jgi:hypothetical protein